jgi:hypothetical protein
MYVYMYMFMYMYMYMYMYTYMHVYRYMCTLHAELAKSEMLCAQLRVQTHAQLKPDLIQARCGLRYFLLRN